MKNSLNPAIKANFNFKLLVDAPPNPCDTKGCSDKCSVVDGAAVCNCSSNPRLILDGTGKNCGERFVDKINKLIRFSE